MNDPTDDIGDGGARLDTEEVDDQFFGPGDADHPENAGGLNLGITDDAVYEGDLEEGERILGEMAESDDVVDGGGPGGDDVPHGEVREHRLRDRHEVEQRAAVTCTTTAGPISMMFHRPWSPNGYDRATSLFERGYYDHSHFFRVVPHFLVQFGISYTKDTELRHFADKTIQDDPKREDLLPFREGMLSFAGSGPNSRTSQLFIAYDRAGGLGTSPWETPFGEVVEGMENVRKLYSGYGDMPPWGKGPEQGPIRNRGSSYIEENFSLLDKFETCTVKRMGASLDENEKGTVKARDAVKETVTERKAMRGSELNARKMSKVKLFQKKNNGDGAVAENQSGKIVIVVIIVALLVVLYRTLTGRKKKQAEKSV